MAIIIDRRFVQKATEKWGNAHMIIPSFQSANLQIPVSAHPDMTLTQIEDIFVASPDSFEYYKSFLGEKVICGKREIKPHYPHDIAYNVLTYKGVAFANFAYTDSVVIKELEKRKIKPVSIKQGYAKCSSCVTENGIITADTGIFLACRENGINALEITPGYVELKGYDYGFLGGASGVIDGKTVFFGDIRKHPDFLKIKEFCEFDFLSDFPLYDVGTIFCI